MSEDFNKNGEPTSCDSTVEEHVRELLVGISIVGLGLGCYTAYKALLEVAEDVRRFHNWPKYEEATGEVVKKLRYDSAENLRQLQEQRLLATLDTDKAVKN